MLLVQSPAAIGSPRPVLILGDSISAAYGMDLEQGWVALLEARLAAKAVAIPVVNASISGETTAGGLRRLPSLLEEYKPSIIFIELGGNDGLRGYPVGQMQANLKKMIQLADNAGAQVLLMPMEIPPNFGQRYATRFREAFGEAVAATDAVLTPSPLLEIGVRTDLMQRDGIHPNVSAQQVLLDALWPSIATALGLEITPSE